MHIFAVDMLPALHLSLFHIVHIVAVLSLSDLLLLFALCSYNLVSTLCAHYSTYNHLAVIFTQITTKVLTIEQMCCILNLTTDLLFGLHQNKIEWSRIMKIKVVGIENVNYFSKKSNRQVQGKSLYFLDLSHVSERLEGNQVGSVFISSNSPVYTLPIVVGETYTMYRDGYTIEYFRLSTEFDDE